MTDKQPPINTSLDIATKRACDALKAAWKLGEFDSHEKLAYLHSYYTDGTNSRSREQQIALAAVDLSFRVKRGKSVDLAEYLSVFPELSTQAGVHGETSVPSDLVRLEWSCRFESGQNPSLAEYQKRYPHLDLSDLASRIELEATIDTDIAKISMDETAVLSRETAVNDADRPAFAETAELELPLTSDSSLPAPSSRALGSLVDQGLISRLQANELEQSHAKLFRDEDTPKSVAAIANELIRRGWLNAFQANTLVTGIPSRLVLGEYVITDQIGQGGMGQVYRAMHRRMKREVALKVLSVDLQENAEALERFRREVETVSRLDHPNIVGAHDADAIGDIHYYVMEMVDGVDLAEHVREYGPVSPRKAVRCILDAASGLEYAHSQGIVHRDIKPHNLMLDRSGTVKVLDLGLARLEQQDGDTGAEGLTGTGNVMGTVDFMAPEQALDSRRADARSDIYSLGCTLYYLLTGRPLFDGDSFMQKLLAHRSNPAPSIKLEFPEGADALESVYQRMLAKDPDDRPQTMAAVIAELEPCLDTLPDDLSATGIDLDATAEFVSPEKSERKAQRSSSLSSLLLGAAVVGLVWIGCSMLPTMLSPKATLVLDLKDDALHGTKVLVDGDVVAKLDGSSTSVVIDLPADSADHQLEVNREGAKPFRQTISMEAATTKLLDIRLVDANQPPPNYALKFDGKSYLEIPSLNLKEASDFTIEFIVDTGPSVAGRIFSASQNVNVGCVLELGQDFRPRFLIGDSGPSQASRFQPAYAAVTALQNLSPNQRHHIAVSVANKMQLFFLDGKLQGKQLLESPSLGADPLRFGEHGFDGSIDEIRFSSIARYTTDFLPANRFDSDPQTIALYHVDEGSGGTIKDDSSNGHDGAITGADWAKVPDVGEQGDIVSVIQNRRLQRAEVPVWAQDPRVSHAIHFDGDNDFLQVPSLMIGDGQGVTYEAWLNADDVSSAATIFCSASAARIPAQGIELRLDDGNLIALANGADSQANAFASEIRTKTPLAVGADVHVAYCYDGASQHLYVNGGLIDSRRVVGMRPSMTTLHVGAGTDGERVWATPSSFFSGYMDEIRISRGRRYDKPFTPAKRLSSDEKTVALYHADEGAGDIVFDHSGNGHHAHLFNARWTRRSDVDTSLRGPRIARVPFDSPTAEALQRSWAEFLGVPIELDNSIGMKFRIVPPGEFYMGSTDSERLDAIGNGLHARMAHLNEPFRHRVLIQTPLYVSTCEVTQRQYMEMMNKNPSEFSLVGKQANRVEKSNTLSHPVESLKFADAVDFCAELTQRENANPNQGKDTADASSFGYRLLTEPEWEFACRAGANAQFGFGDDVSLLPDYAWVKENSGDRTMPVGQLRPNAFGLFDMHGNVAEKVTDPVDALASIDQLTAFTNPMPLPLRGVQKGGAFAGVWSFCRASTRSSSIVDSKQGFRVALPITAETLPYILGHKQSPANLSARAEDTPGVDSKFDLPKRSPNDSPSARLKLARLISVRLADVTDHAKQKFEIHAHRAVEELEWLADRRHIVAADLKHSDFEALHQYPRFLLLTDRIRLTSDRGSDQIENLEGHWRQLGAKYLSKDDPHDWRDLHVKEPLAAILYAAIAILNDDDDAFEAHYRDCIAKEVSSVPVLLLLRKNSLKETRRSLESRLELLQRDPQPYFQYRIAGLHYRLGEWEQAIAAAEKTFAMPWNEDVIWHLIVAMAMHQSGEKEEARRYFTEKVGVSDSKHVSQMLPLHIIDISITAVLRQEAESLLFGHSDSRELNEIMGQSRAGEVANALRRLSKLEQRVNDLSPRLRYQMARSYAQCWHHLAESHSDAGLQLSDGHDRIRVRDRVVELLRSVHAAQALDTDVAHLALDFRPLLNDAVFQEAYAKVSPRFNAAIVKAHVLTKCARAYRSGDEMPEAELRDCVDMLFSIAGSGNLDEADLKLPDYRVLDLDDRFVVLSDQIAGDSRLPTPFPELFQSHWREAYERFRDAMPEERIRLVMRARVHQHIVQGGMAFLAGNEVGYERQCEIIARRYGQRKGHIEQRYVAELQLFDPKSKADRNELLVLATNAARDGDSHSVATKCLAHYRLKQFDQALAEVKKLDQASEWWSQFAKVLRAMILHSRGDTEDARVLFQTYRDEADRELRMPKRNCFIVLRIFKDILDREAELLILGKSDRLHLDSILSLARTNKVDEAIKQLAEFDRRIKNLPPAIKRDVARAYSQCYGYLASREDHVKDADMARRKSLALIGQLAKEKTVHTPAMSEFPAWYLALDFKPLQSDPEYISLCRSMNSTMDATLSTSETLRQSKTGEHGSAATRALQLLNTNEFLSVHQRRALTTVLARYVESLRNDAALTKTGAADRGAHAVWERLRKQADSSTLSQRDLALWQRKFTWLDDENALASLKDRIRATRSLQRSLVHRVLRLNGTVAIELRDGPNAAQQQANRRENRVTQVDEIPDGDFAVWKIIVEDEETFGDAKLSKLIQDASKVSTVDVVRIRNVAVSTDGLVILRHLNTSVTHIDLADNVAVDDLCLAVLAELDQLEELVLSGTSITDNGLIYLQTLQNLQKVDLTKTNLSADAIAAFKERLPNCQIQH